MHRPIVAAVVVLMLGTAVSGCSAPGFISRPVDNFRAYYNTFYNARKAYKRGVEGQATTGTVERKVDRLQYVDIFAGQGDGRPSADLENAIRKSADVLRDHPDSKWVDDALLLIGKAYFHQRNLVGAEQKFEEVIELGTGLEDEARFWHARTLIASGRLEAAEAAIDEALAREDIDHKWESMLRLARGELRVEEESWEDAADQLVAGLEDVPEADVGARAQFLLGQVLETLGRYREAEQAYRDVGRFRPTYEWSYAAKYNAVRVRGLYVDPRRALDEVRGLERDDKHFAYRAELALLRGRILKQMGLADEAWTVYDLLLYDEEYRQLIGDLRGRIHYALGELYRDLDKDFVLAAAHFDTAAAQLRGQMGQNASRTAGGTAARALQEPRWAPEAILDAEELKEAFGEFAKVYAEVSNMDSLLTLGALDDEAFEVRLLEIRQQRAREIEEERRRQEALAVEQAFARASSGSGSTSPSGTRPGSASGRNPVAAAGGFLFHRDAVQAEEGMISFRQEWGDRPLARNWRRIDALSRLPENELTDEFANGIEGEEEEGEVQDQLPQIDISPIPRDSVSQARMRGELASAEYDLANTLFLGMERPDSAASWYRLVVDQRDDEELSRRALFALAEVQQALGDSVSAAGIFEQIVQEYPDSEFANRGRLRLGLPVVVTEEADSLALAEAAYARPYESWQRGDYADAIDGMIAVAGEIDSVPIRPRALLAAGTIYMQWADRDSLDLFAPIPIHVPDSVLVGIGLLPPPPMSVPVLIGGIPHYVPVDTTTADTSAATAVSPDDGDVVAADSAAGSVGVDAIAVSADPQDAVRSDSLAEASPDASGAVPSDSLAEAPSDLSGAVPSDSLAASGSPDSARDGADPSVGFVDLEAWRQITAEDLFTHVQDMYESTPFAERAGLMLTGLEARRAALAAVRDSIAAVRDSLRADSLAALAPDSTVLAADSLTASPDSLLAPSAAVPAADEALAAAPGTETAQDSVAAPVRSSNVDPSEWREVASLSARPLDDVGGEFDGWMIVLQDVDDLAAAPVARQRYQGRLAEFGTVEIITGRLDAGEVILIALGRFASREEAEAAGRAAGIRIPPAAWLLHVLPFED